MRLTTRTLVVLGTLLGIVIVWSSNQIVPATSAYQAQMRVWIFARAAGTTAYLILTFVIAIGLILSHPVNKSTWKLSKRIFPWHENLLVFTIAFTAAHVVAIVLDPYAGVSPVGALVPGLSSFRSVPVALGTLALYALLITGLTARYTKVLPPGVWLKLHRLSIVVWGLAWGHGILAGTDTGGFSVLYVATGLAILASSAYRYWVGKQGRPTFSSSLPSTVHDRPVHGTPAHVTPPTIAAALGPTEGASP
jgi:predicted ferric reductase